MARIRTIKPEFFTSEDIVALSPLARLLYIALWCEADREGRLAWKPRTFKMRYLPADECDINALCAELVDSGLISLYGDGLAYIPAFSKHQHFNPREAASTLPAPDACGTRDPRVEHASSTRNDRDDDASATRGARVDHATVTMETRDSDAQAGREGKGREGDRTRPAGAGPPAAVAEPKSKRGTRLPTDWRPTELQVAWAAKERPDLDIARTADRFRDYWIAKAGADACKLDWDATWRNWVRNESGGSPPRGGAAPAGHIGMTRALPELR